MRVTIGVTCVLVMFAWSCGGGDAGQPAPVVASAPPAPAATPTTPLPSSNPDADAVEAARPSLRACYDKARSANPALGRTMVTLAMHVEGGHVFSVNIEYKQRFDDASKQCMRDAALAIAFPPGDPRKVEIPVTFEAR
jgi:hypothetical protein